MNPAYYKTFKYPDNIDVFWSKYKNNNILNLIKQYAKQSKKEYLRSKIIHMICKLGVLSMVKKMLRK